MKKIPNILAFLTFFILCLVAFSNKKTQEVVNEINVIPEQNINKETYPVKISIQSIGVLAPVESVGVLDGAMAVPTFGQNVGWYKYGTKPGDPGSSVLAGHVNWMNGEDAVFTNLKNIEVGDVVSVTNNYGEIDNFKVVKIRNFPIGTDTTEVFISSDGVSRLNLITCDGTWNDFLNTHESRLVVFTEKI